MKATVEQIEYLINEMRKAENEHPKAKVYFDWEDNEIRITYPLPKNYEQMESFNKSFNIK